MRKQKLLIALSTLALTFSAAFTSFAGAWRFEGPEIWQRKYVNDDGSICAPGWQQIDGKWYHFDEDSYLDIDMHSIDGNSYYFSSDPETLGQMYENVGYLTGFFGFDGAWQDNEAIENTWSRWISGEGWTEADEASWQMQFAVYGINDSLFVPYNQYTTGETHQLRLFVPETNNAALYDIGNTLAMKLYMLTDGMASYSWVMEVDEAGNIFIVFDYQYYG